MSEALRKIAENPAFVQFVTGVILIAGVVVGIETSHDLSTRFHGLLDAVDKLILLVFAIEAAVRLGAYGWRYFTDPWDIFDFSVLVVAVLPLDAHYVALLRLARLLRVLRLVRALPRLRILVGALLNSIPSMGYVGILLGMLFYVYAVAGVFMFGANDPSHFGSLPIAFLSLFRVVTGDAWTDLMYMNMYGCEAFGADPSICTQPEAHTLVAPFYFVSFVLVGAMVILNLFIGVIVNGMEEAKLESAELDRKNDGENASPAMRLDEILAKLDQTKSELEALRHSMEEAPRERQEPDRAA